MTAQGDGSWLIDAAGEPVGGGLAVARFARGGHRRRTTFATDAYRAHYALTGSGLNACMASAQLAWMKRRQPDRLARAATCFHCKDWLYFKLTGARVTDPSEGNFTFGNFRTRKYEPSILEGMGIADCARLLPPMIEGSQERGRLAATAAAETLLPEGLPVSLAYLDVVCTALGGRTLRSRRRNRRLHPRFDRHAHALRADPRGRASQRGPLRLHDVPADRARLRVRCSPTWRRPSTSTG